jgi:hypothetical protein
MGCGAWDILKDFIENIKILMEYPALNSRDYSGLDMYRGPFQLHTKKSPEGRLHWQSTRGETHVYMGGRFTRRCCQTFRVSQPEAECSE